MILTFQGNALPCQTIGARWQLLPHGRRALNSDRYSIAVIVLLATAFGIAHVRLQPTTCLTPAPFYPLLRHRPQPCEPVSIVDSVAQPHHSHSNSAVSASIRRRNLLLTIDLALCMFGSVVFFASPAAGQQSTQSSTSSKNPKISKVGTSTAVSLVCDQTNLLVPSSEKYLDAIMRQLESETKVKLRLVCPPNGVILGRESWKEYSSPIFKEWAVDQSTLVIIAEQRVRNRIGQMYNLFSFIPGEKLQERFQYKLTNDFLQSSKAHFGTPQYVDTKGTDAAICETVQSLVAAIYTFIEYPSYRLRSPLSEQEVEAILKRHGDEPSTPLPFPASFPIPL